MKRYNSVYDGVYTKPNEMVEEPNGDWVRWEDVQREYAREWITDRMPTSKDGIYVYDQYGQIEHHSRISLGQPWKPITKPAPYVKPKRWTLVWWQAIAGQGTGWKLRDNVKRVFIPLYVDSLGLVNNDDEHRKAAERIAAIYEEVMP